MSDNPKKKKLDGKRISKQPWEQAYQRRKKARLQKQVVTQAEGAEEAGENQPSKVRRPTLRYESSSNSLPPTRRLASAVSKMEEAIERSPMPDSEPFAFCKEWKEKGKPIFNMVLSLFSFRPKTSATIKRIMNGIDGLCEVPYDVLEY